ncbi:PE/PPE C-terminal domain-containing protein [Mycobacterium marseillense]|uniref:PE/PPE C-terminal domain-containing protein n=1 Tax=Mycobacterium marseillense TaxID=701042 RepID=UPI003BAAC5E7
MECAGLAKATLLGSLSVPPGWAVAAREGGSASVSLSAHSVDVAPAVDIGPGRAFRESLMGMLSAGCGVGNYYSENHESQPKGK